LAEQLVNDLGLIGLFLAALLAASLLPFPVEALVPLMVNAGYSSVGIVIAGTAGGYVGSLVNYRLAAHGEAWWRTRHPRRTALLDRMHLALGRWGAPVLILSWLPVVGEVVTVVAGLARVPLGPFSFWTILGRALRMVGLVHLSFLVF
jgi:membrane protein YqaA with SNARE-associated domain